MSAKHDLLSLCPVSSYAAPAYPTKIDAGGDSALLKKLPSRWQKGAAAACVGLMGAAALTGCPPPWPHGGGSGGAPMYVAHLTEQEALAVIRPLLEAAGLVFGAPPAVPYIVYIIGWGAVGIELFDQGKNVGIALLAERQGDEYCQGSSHMKDEVAKAFSLLDPNLKIGVFFCPGEYFQNGTPSANQKEKMKEALEAHFTKQAGEFIEQLRNKGVLPP